MITGLKKWHVFVLFLLIGAALYSNVMRNGIFIFDDNEYVMDNPLIQDFTHLDLSDPRQMGYLSFALNYALGKDDPRGYHVLNVMIHITNAMLVYVLVRLLLGILSGTAGMRENLRTATAFLAALIFLVHPVETMAVSYIAQRFTSLATLFYLTCIIAYLLARIKFETDRTSRTGYLLYSCSLVSALLAVRTKEIAFTIPAILTAMELLAFRGSVFSRRRFIYIIPYAALVMIIPLSIFGPEMGLIGGGEGIAEVTRQEKVYDFVERSPFTYLVTQFRVIVTYMRLLLMPVGQRVIYDYKISQSLFDGRVLLALSLIGLTLTATYRVWRRSLHMGPDSAPGAKLAVLGIAWFFITLSVESSIIPIKDMIFEHRTYLPSVGFFAACSAGMVWGVQRISVKRSFSMRIIIVILLVALPLATATIIRNVVWTNELTFWDDVVKKNPNKAIGYHNRGNAYGRLGMYELALKDINKTISFFPKNPAEKLSYENADFTPSNMAKTYMNRGQVYLNMGLKEKGQAEFARAKDLVSRPPLDTERALKTADYYAKQGAYKNAIEEYTKILQWNPEYLDALNNRANAYSWTSNYRQAIEDLSRVILLYPDYVPAYYNRGTAYAWSNQREKATTDFKTACDRGFEPACEGIKIVEQGGK